LLKGYCTQILKNIFLGVPINLQKCRSLNDYSYSQLLQFNKIIQTRCMEYAAENRDLKKETEAIVSAKDTLSRSLKLMITGTGC
jgi:hypothetical protein